MVWRPSSNSAGRALLLLALAGPAGAPVTSIALFGADLKRLTGDWVAEDWDDGAIKMHPDRYNEFADGFYLTTYAPEPAEGRSVTDVARAHFDGYEMDDDTLEPTIVNMDGAKEIAPGIIARMYGWAAPPTHGSGASSPRRSAAPRSSWAARRRHLMASWR